MSASEPLLQNFSDPVVVQVKSYRKMPRFCGPKLSNCCFVLSIWGVVMLLVMGVLFRFNSVALIEDIPKFEDEHGVMDVDKGYQEASTNCFIGAGLYFVTFVFTGYQKYAISKGYSRL